MGVIEWKCDRCGRVFTEHHGFLGIKTKEIIDASRSRKAWEEEFFVDGRWSLRHPPAPAPARWYALHDECVLRDEEFDYWVPGEHVDTPAKVIGFLCHKHQTIYIDKTDFFEFLIRQGVPRWL